MGICYPFRFRRDPEPARATLTIAAADTLDPARLVAVREGSGQRIAIVGSGEACAMLADQSRDLLIDPARGNWDFFADHVSAYARASAIEAFLPDDPAICASYTCASRFVLLRAIEHAGDLPGSSLAAARDLIGALPPEAVAEVAGHDPANGHALRWAMTVLAGARQATQALADPDPYLPRVSITRWLAGPASIALFVQTDPNRSCREVDAIVAALHDQAMLRHFEVADTGAAVPAPASTAVAS